MSSTEKRDTSLLLSKGPNNSHSLNSRFVFCSKKRKLTFPIQTSKKKHVANRKSQYSYKTNPKYLKPNLMKKFRKQNILN